MSNSNNILGKRQYRWGLVLFGELDDLNTIREKLSDMMPSGVKLIYETTTPSKLLLIEK